MAAVRGIFSISDATFLKKNNYWTDLSDVWTNNTPNIGYFTAGATFSGPKYSYVDKTFFTSDTTISSPSSFINGRTSHCTLGSLENGYILGGFVDGPTPTTDWSFKLSFSTDVSTLNPATNFLENSSAATGNFEKGYIAGGQQTSNISRLYYSSDTLTLIPSKLSFVRYSFSATGSEIAGYYFGGNFSETTTDKITYSSDTCSLLPSAALSSSWVDTTASGNPTEGYFGTGFFSSTRGRLARIKYSTETYDSGASLLFNPRSVQSTGNSSNAFFTGGFSPSPGYTTMNKLSYSTGTVTDVVTGRLSFGRYDTMGVSPRDHAVNLWTRFSDGSTTNNIASLPPETVTSTTASSITRISDNTGFFVCGSSGVTPFSHIEKLLFATDTMTNLPSKMSSSRYDVDAVGNGLSAFVGGGSGPGPAGSSIMQKLTYSTDTCITAPQGSFTPGGYVEYMATGNQIAGYYAGGSEYDGVSQPYQNLITSIYKINFTREFLEKIPATTSLGRMEGVACGNQIAGYFAGGEDVSGNDYSTIEKLSYSSETCASLPSSGYLSYPRAGSTAIGNSTEGYFCGGFSPFSPPTPDPRNSVDTLIYSTDTRELVPGITLPTSLSSSAGGTGNSADGYVRSNKITYATSTVVLSPSSDITVLRSNFTASSSRENGIPENYLGPVFV